MIELAKNKYLLLIPFVKQVSFNHLFAESVLKDVVNGKVYVDCDVNPSSFYILHSYGMSLLFGNENNPAFNSWLQNYLLNKNGKRTKEEWLQVFPGAWHNRLGELLGDGLKRKRKTQEIIDEAAPNRVVECTRVNFKFEYNAYSLFRENLNPKSFDIIETNKKLYEKMNGVVVPKAFWKNAELFQQSGIGFSLLVDGELSSTAYSAFIHDRQLELGVETIKEFQGQGLASVCCAKLIDYCIAKDFEPVWSCKLENTASLKLAQKLGFVPISYRPYYQVKI